MPDKAWKKRERDVANYFKGARTPLSGGNGKVTRADVLKGRGVFNKGGRATSVMGRGQGKVIKHKKTIMV